MSDAVDFVVVMGVAGTGKSAVGERLAAELGGAFVEADRYHSAANVARMQAGIGLTDAERQPWLEAVSAAALASAPRPAVIACSALRRSYRDLLRARLPGLRLVFLDGPRELIAQRLGARAGHFAGGTLLPSQLATLEPPAPDEATLSLSIALPVEALVAAARAWLDENPGDPSAAR